MLRNLLLLLHICIALNALSQKEYNNWYFGINAAINFNTTPPKVKYNSEMFARIASASISDKNTGDLLFYTDGNTVWNKNHQVMKNGSLLSLAGYPTDVQIVPFLNDDNRYYIFYRPVQGGNAVIYVTVDMNLQNGLGEVIKGNIIKGSPSSNLFFIAKHAVNRAYWFVTFDFSSGNGNFYSKKITENGIDTTTITSKYTSPELQRLGGITTSSDGTKIGITYYDPDSAAIYIHNFDKICGTISPPISLHIEPNWKLAQGISFSPDNSKLYVSLVSPTGGKIVQYYGANFGKWQIVATVKQNFNGLRLGPDNQLYISINNDANHSPSSRVDILLYPNELGNRVEYIENYLDLGDMRTTNYAFPNMIYDKSQIGGANKNEILVKNICVGDTSIFSLTEGQMLDSVLWDFGDGSIKINKTNPNHIYADTGSYTITATPFSCGQTWSTTKTINIVKSPSINWSSDSVFCYNGELKLITPFNTGSFTWNTNETTQNIKVNKEGLYWVNVVLGSCKVSDSIYIKELPPILIELGLGYTVCEHDTDDLVKLDAGKGYAKYKWTPTQDTTQWIIVRQAGDYYVVVEDFRGCKGDDGSKVLRLCSFDFHIPNAFTPNGDGLNDVFKATALDIYKLNFEIYNTWGERVFKTNNPQQGWDGTYKDKLCPEGVYLYKISFNGFSNKQLRTYNFKGNVSLLR